MTVTAIKYCDNISGVIGDTQTVETRDDCDSSGWGEITMNELLVEMDIAKGYGIDGAMHLMNFGMNYDHFCPGCSNMTLIGANYQAAGDYVLAHPRTYACLHIIQPKTIAKTALDTPEAFVRLSYSAIAKARYSAWWNHLDPRVWKRTGIGNGHLPNGGAATAVEIAINFCVEIT
ncbi:MAG TPA: hypothetical protein VF459_06615 [Caulobacteraceae bacterium]